MVLRRGRPDSLLKGQLGTGQAGGARERRRSKAGVRGRPIVKDATGCSALSETATAPQSDNAERYERAEWQITQWCGCCSAPTVARMPSPASCDGTDTHNRSSSPACGNTSGASHASTSKAASQRETLRRRGDTDIRLRVAQCQSATMPKCAGDARPPGTSVPWHLGNFLR
jgi:hypothetical protein